MVSMSCSPPENLPHFTVTGHTPTSTVLGYKKVANSGFHIFVMAEAPKKPKKSKKMRKRKREHLSKGLDKD